MLRFQESTGRAWTWRGLRNSPLPRAIKLWRVLPALPAALNHRTATSTSGRGWHSSRAVTQTSCYSKRASLRTTGEGAQGRGIPSKKLRSLEFCFLSFYFRDKNHPWNCLILLRRTKYLHVQVLSELQSHPLDWRKRGIENQGSHPYHGTTTRAHRTQDSSCTQKTIFHHF